MTDSPDAFDWDGLLAAAREAMAFAYAPYSHYPVGAAARVDDGRVVVGCNVENAAYGVALCAECGMVSQLHVTGGGRLTKYPPIAPAATPAAIAPARPRPPPW